MQTKDILKELSPYVPGKTIEEVKEMYGLEKIVKLASNENPYGFSPHVKHVLEDSVSSLEKYPDGYARELRRTLSRKLDVSERQLIFGNGSDEIVQLICRTFLEAGTNTVMATPTFPQYRHNALIEGAEVREVELVDGDHDLDEMLSQIDEQTRVVWLCNPNNPTGNIIRQESFEQFMKAVPSHTLVVVDEAYVEYVTSDDFADAFSALDTYSNLMITRTFSKAYGLAALRVGYGISNESLIEQIEPAREPFNTSVFAQKGAIAALEDQPFIQEAVRRNIENKERLQAFCDQHELSYFPSETNFLLVHLPMTGDEMVEHLLKNGYIVRSGEALGIPNSVRITIGSEEEVEGLTKAMEEKLTEVVPEK
ncbi:histidinol-phosphate aminotransferase [Pontibacillus halophilus JSM 076056 = DSM 19796]|uniref:Histidinol-phosphate aminotransferase n=1 Tax=Pontibacillus halophilus JSM 076056 = DSM 19796 TaxID=1385510 RepID=A0A0A5GLP9_9BACI|nr:histidinol-phosphate transaminase [Pontibacillus halophilus]KGX92158.1 histidinol-phosphate aminotransferase [Pontibacillus halophilus JSM 076056 = DSM 19796]